MNYNKFTYTDYLQHVKSGDFKCVAGRRHSQSSDSGFYQTPNFKTAFNYAVKGWAQGIKKLEQIETRETVKKTRRRRASRSGSRYNIGRVISGHPTPCYKTQTIKRETRRQIDVYIKLSYTADVKGETALNYAGEVLQHVNELQQKNDIRLIGVFDTHLGKKKRDVCDVILKEYSTPLEFNTIAFACHPSFFRRVRWRDLECSQYAKGAKGSSLNDSAYIERIKDQNAKEGKQRDAYILHTCQSYNYDKLYKRAECIVIKAEA